LQQFFVKIYERIRNQTDPRVDRLTIKIMIRDRPTRLSCINPRLCIREDGQIEQKQSLYFVPSSPDFELGEGAGKLSFFHMFNARRNVDGSEVLLVPHWISELVSLTLIKFFKQLLKRAAPS